MAPIAARWRRHDGHLVGLLKGAHGGFVTIVDTTAAPLLRVEVVLPESVPAGLEARVAEACLQANRDWAGARLYWTRRFDGAVCSEASLTVGPHATAIDPLVVRALLLRCIATAASIPALVSAVERGVSPYDAPSFAADNQLLAFAVNAPGAPATDEELIESCLAAAEAVGWPARCVDTAQANSPNCAHFIIEHPGAGPAIATVEVTGGCLHASTIILSPEDRQRVPVDRRPAVAELLNGLANRTSRCAFALDLDEGFVRTGLILDTAGCTTAPSASSCATSSCRPRAGALFRDMIVRVAHRGVEADEALTDFEVNASAQQ